MNESRRLHADGFINDEQNQIIQSYEAGKPLSVHWELLSILYTGVILLTSGAGILIYSNIDTVGHQIVLALIAAAAAGCFYYAFKTKHPFSRESVSSPSVFFDYAVLCGCILTGIFIGYIQYQYNLFGSHYGIALLIPTVIFFISAYIFDHKGVLSLGISGLAGWAGISVTPMGLLTENDFSSSSLIFPAIVLGFLVTLFAYYCDIQNIKRHFSFSYNNFSANILFIAVLAALFGERFKILSFLLLCILCFYFVRYAIREQSFLFLLLSVIYGYIGFTYSFFAFMLELNDSGEIIFTGGIFYVLASCVGIIAFFVNYRSILRIKK